jgi:flagellar hook assembly protein FlgD
MASTIRSGLLANSRLAMGVTDENRFELCPRFIEKVEFTVVNRWGKTVFEYVSDFGENTIYINWDGKTNEGRLLSSGYYFYSANSNRRCA